MTIREANEKDFPAAKEFFAIMCEEMAKKDFLHSGNQGGYPSDEMICNGIRERELFLGEENGETIAAYFLDNHADEEYNRVSWQIDVPKEQVGIIHALRVKTAFSGHGIGKQMMSHCIETGRKRGQKAIRLDTLDDNIVAQSLYRSLGFMFRGTVDIFYEDIGEMRTLFCFELVI